MNRTGTVSTALRARLEAGGCRSGVIAGMAQRLLSERPTRIWRTL
jgi:hypothetical protein